MRFAGTSAGIFLQDLPCHLPLPPQEEQHPLPDHLAAVVTLTDCRMSASLLPSNTIRLKLTLAARFAVANGCGLVMTKLNEVPAFDDNAGRFFVPPMTHLADCRPSCPVRPAGNRRRGRIPRTRQGGWSLSVARWLSGR